MNNEDSGNFLRLSQEKMLQMTDETMGEAMSEMEMMDGLVQDRYFKIKKTKKHKKILNFINFEIFFLKNKYKKRDVEINKLVETINELTSIFKQMAELVYEQGTILDRIDFNIEETLSNTKKANQQLTIV